MMLSHVVSTDPVIGRELAATGEQSPRNVDQSETHAFAHISSICQPLIGGKCASRDTGSPQAKTNR